MTEHHLCCSQDLVMCSVCKASAERNPYTCLGYLESLSCRRAERHAVSVSSRKEILLLPFLFSASLWNQLVLTCLLFLLSGLWLRVSSWCLNVSVYSSLPFMVMTPWGIWFHLLHLEYGMCWGMWVKKLKQMCSNWRTWGVFGSWLCQWQCHWQFIGKTVFTDSVLERQELSWGWRWNWFLKHKLQHQMEIWKVNDQMLLLVILCEAFNNKMPTSVELVNVNFHVFFLSNRYKNVQETYVFCDVSYWFLCREMFSAYKSCMWFRHTRWRR